MIDTSCDLNFIDITTFKGDIRESILLSYTDGLLVF